MVNQSLLALACGDSYGSYFKLDGLCGNIWDETALWRWYLFYSL